MASYATNEGQGEEVTSGDIQDLMVQKAHELFIVCDKESKGFITKRDMQRLETELPLSPEQLEAVFDSLDDDSNGYLTLEEFTDGFVKKHTGTEQLSPIEPLEEESCVKLSIEELKSFRSFLGMTPTLEHQDSLASSGGGSAEQVYENERHEGEWTDDEDRFDDLLGTIGAHGIFEDEDVIQSLWTRIRRDEPELLPNFEDFLGRVSVEIKRSHSDLNTLESALKNKNLSHDEEVRKLYDEMENQIRLEKERILTEEKARERQLREEMDSELMEKEKQLVAFQQKTYEMEDRLERLNSHESETKLENEKLLREKEELEVMLVQAQRHLDESKTYINSLRQKHKDEKRERAMAALQISEGIAMERESLVKQLDMLREMNRKLRDDKDERDMRRDGYTLDQELEEAIGPASSQRSGPQNKEKTAEGDPDGKLRRQTSRDRPRKRPHLAKQGSVLSNYFGETKSMSIGSDSIDVINEEDGIECDHYDYVPNTNNVTGLTSNQLLYAPEEDDDEELYNARPDGASGARGSVSDSEEIDYVDGSHQRNLQTSISSPEDVTTIEELRNGGVINGSLLTMTREQPVGANDLTTLREPSVESVPSTPERVFKVVFVGDSGVGKSSFIHRFCNSEFKATFSATIGVDFQVKSMVVDNHCVALQLWDTAGQERFRSITKQYFRKADGVLIMYDVTSESSFLNVRNWFVSVEDGCEEGTVLVLVGNKTDLSEDDEKRVIKTKDGATLADEFKALFYETSAKSGDNVIETVAAMASILQEREDREMEKALQLSDAAPEKKMGCCS